MGVSPSARRLVCRFRFIRFLRGTLCCTRCPRCIFLINLLLEAPSDVWSFNNTHTHRTNRSNYLFVGRIKTLSLPFSAFDAYIFAITITNSSWRWSRLFLQYAACYQMHRRTSRAEGEVFTIEHDKIRTKRRELAFFYCDLTLLVGCSRATIVLPTVCLLASLPRDFKRE